MRVVLVLLVLIALSLLARFGFGRRGATLLKNLFSAVALALGAIFAYILFISVIQGHSLF